MSTAPPPALETIRDNEKARTMGLVSATAVGVGAIVGGGVLVLAGVAFQYTGPGALVAFFLNGLIAVLTALSFAEVSTRFPESGGTYAFAKRLLSVRAAFAAGWILWFAYIVAGVLYALGFASYAVELLRVVFFPLDSPAWLQGRVPIVVLSLVPTVLYSVSLIRKASGGGQWATWGKVAVFVVLLLAGSWALATTDVEQSFAKLSPFFLRGATGLFQAMGLTFIAIQGFDLIAAVAGEVKDPVRTIPRSMLLSLGVAMLIYLPLILIVTTVGTPLGTSVSAMSAENPGTAMARAARLFMGPTGYWLVMIAALLSTLSALGANLLAASRVAHSMAQDRTLPAVIAQVHPTYKTPHMAIYASALTLTALLLAVPDLAAAGSAAGLIFLTAFALTHYTSMLARSREGEPVSHVPEGPPAADTAPPRCFTAPYYPLVPVVGGLCCVGMAAFQAVAEPAAGGVALVWLGLGGFLYVSLFSDRAETFDAFEEARDPMLAKMRGRNPLVLVPVANPKTAQGMVEVAAALAPPRVGRVMLLRVIAPPAAGSSSLADLQTAQLVMGQALNAAFGAGHRPEGLVTIAEKPWREIGRVVRSHGCGGLVLGIPTELDALSGGPLEELINELDCDVTLVRCDEGWRPRKAQKVLVPVGRRGHDVELRARMMGSLQMAGRPQITWVSIMESAATQAYEAETRRKLLRLARDNVYGVPNLMLVRSDDPITALVELAETHDLMILGLHRGADGQRQFGEFNSTVVSRTHVATLLIGGR